MYVAAEVQVHQARCVAPLISLRMLAHGDSGTPPPWCVLAMVCQATRTVLAEAEAAGQVALAAAGAGNGHPGGRTFLRVRLNRLEAAAGDAIAAARAGEPAEMSRHLLRFDALTAAIWAVQDTVYGSRRVSAGA